MLAVTKDDADLEGPVLLEVLSHVERDHGLTQRALATEMNVALGLANAYIKRCIRKGLIKVSQAPAQRYAYYLTPHGFAEKSRLVAEYLRGSLDFFRTARSQCDALLQGCAHNGWTRIALHGTGDLADIFRLSAAEWPVTLVGVVSETAAGPLPVVARPELLAPHDALVLLDMINPQQCFDRLAPLYGDRLLVLPLFRLSRPAGSTP